MSTAKELVKAGDIIKGDGWLAILMAGEIVQYISIEGTDMCFRGWDRLETVNLEECSIHRPKLSDIEVWNIKKYAEICEQVFPNLKEMTIEEIQKELGHPVKIIG